VLYTFGFDHVGVVISDLYFLDPVQKPGQEGAERGVRLEVRLLDRPELQGSIYAAQPIAVGRPIWRADLLETVSGPFGSFDRTHHHPAFTGWEPGTREFDRALSADPIPWLGQKLSDLEALVETSEVDTSEITKADIDGLRKAVPEILAATQRLLEGVYAGELAQPPESDEPLVGARASWL
jgi:hypothetical protein